VLAWIASRDPKVVEDFAPDKTKRPTAKWSQIFGGAAQQKFEAAFNEMKYKAMSGQLPARGCPWHDRDGQEGDRCQIEASHWGAGAKLWDQVLRTKQQISHFGVPYVEEWVRVWFDRASVLRLWPPPDAASVSTETAPVSTAAPVSRETVPVSKETVPVSKEEDKREPSPIPLLAEWIYRRHVANFANRGKPEKKAEILKAARHERPPPMFTTQQFNEAYQLVFASRQHKPPASGWPLNPTYQKRPPRKNLWVAGLGGCG
jgi:hypothetical protein